MLSWAASDHTGTRVLPFRLDFDCVVTALHSIYLPISQVKPTSQTSTASASLLDFMICHSKSALGPVPQAIAKDSEVEQNTGCLAMHA